MFKGLGNLANLAQMFRQAQQMGSRMQGISEQLRGQRVTGSAGGGLVTVEANGLGELIACRIDPSLMNDREMLEDLLPAAVNQAQTKARDLHAQSMRGLTEGVDLPGLDEVLAQVSGGAAPPNDSSPKT